MLFIFKSGLRFMANWGRMHRQFWVYSLPLHIHGLLLALSLRRVPSITVDEPETGLSLTSKDATYSAIPRTALSKEDLPCSTPAVALLGSNAGLGTGRREQAAGYSHILGSDGSVDSWLVCISRSVVYGQAEVSKRALRIGQQTDLALCSFWCGGSWVRALTASGRGGDELSVIYLGESNEVTPLVPILKVQEDIFKGLRDLHLKAPAHKQENEPVRSNAPLNKSIFSVCLQRRKRYGMVQGSGARIVGWIPASHFFSSVCPWAHHCSMPPCSHL